MAPDSVEWRRVLGDCLPPGEYPDLEQAWLSHPARAVRTPQVGADLPFATSPVEWYARGRLLSDTAVRPGGQLHFAAGDYYIQDAGSMLALALCQAQPGEVVLDACAAPGGKSTGLLEQLGGTGRLLANEVIHGRVATLRWMLERSGYDNYVVASRDLEFFAEGWPAEFDCVMVDAPCSGQSLLVRGKQSMSAFSEQHIQHNAARQQRILQHASRVVRPGGRLVYSTCTFAQAENEGVVEWFLSTHPGWELDRHDGLSAWESRGLPGTYRLWPHRHPSAGAFAAALRRLEEPAPQEAAAEQRAGKSSLRKAWHAVDASTQAEWFVEKADAHWLARGNWLNRFAGNLPEHWIVASLGSTRIAELKSKHWQPAYGAARLEDQALSGRPTIALNTEQASQFVAGQVLRVPEHAAGWQVACWQGRPLGWAKLSKGSLKNHFPKPLRTS